MFRNYQLSGGVQYLEVYNFVVNGRVVHVHTLAGIIIPDETTCYEAHHHGCE